MKFVRASLIAIAFSAISIGFGYAQFGVARTVDNKEAAACARCGDGVCAKSCETAASCPRDCGGVPSKSSR